jgi:hypothetical protein
MSVRTTLDIDEDILEAAKALARQMDKTAGAVLSDLAGERSRQLPLRVERERTRRTFDQTLRAWYREKG